MPNKLFKVITSLKLKMRQICAKTIYNNLEKKKKCLNIKYLLTRSSSNVRNLVSKICF